MPTTRSSLGDISNTNIREGKKEQQLIVSVEERATERGDEGRGPQSLRQRARIARTGNSKHGAGATPRMR